MLDPVCGVQVSEDDAAICLSFLDRRYCFCSLQCEEEFVEHPERYVLRDQDQWSGIEGVA
ncbi:MAG: YHS domain-containing protein [Armatimonadota bacterium]|nr:YHS domain-containing protein [Armatimonadota bacterium]